MTFVEKYRKSRQQRDNKMRQKLNQLNEQKLKNRQQYIQKQKQSIVFNDQINQKNDQENFNLIYMAESKMLDVIQKLLQLEKENKNIEREIQKSQQYMQQTLRALHEEKQNQLLKFKRMLQLVNCNLRVIQEQQIPNQQFVISVLQDEYLMQQINERIAQAEPQISISLTRESQKLVIACRKIQQVENIMKKKQLAQETARKQIENLSNRLTQEKFQIKMLVEQNIKMVQKLGDVKKLLKEMFQLQI